MEREIVISCVSAPSFHLDVPWGNARSGCASRHVRGGVPATTLKSVETTNTQKDSDGHRASRKTKNSRR